MFVGTGTSSSSVAALLSRLAATRPGPVRSPGSDGAQAGSGVRRSLLSSRSVVLRLDEGGGEDREAAVGRGVRRPESSAPQCGEPALALEVPLPAIEQLAEELGVAPSIVLARPSNLLATTAGARPERHRRDWRARLTSRLREPADWTSGHPADTAHPGDGADTTAPRAPRATAARFIDTNSSFVIE